jgi:uncharacterized OB-fold protein/acyl dehydratase
MIRHFVEAVGDENPVYVDAGAARSAGLPGVVAPPAMLQAWVMRGLKATQELERARAGGGGRAGTAPASAQDEVLARLDAEGFTSVVATNCEQEYFRPLVLGDHLSASSRVESVSDEKKTALGPGRFVTTLTEMFDQAGELVAVMRFRLLKFRPAAPSATTAATSAGATAGAATAGATAAGAPARASREDLGAGMRPGPVLTRDNAFFFEGARLGKLLVQRCSSCGTLRHPPAPSCAACRSLEWDAVESCGRGVVYSFAVVHHPQVAGFEYPLVVALVELEEGTRLVADLEGVAPADVRIGMAVEVGFAPLSPEIALPVFRPSAPSRK